MIRRALFILLCLYLCRDNFDRAIVIIVGGLILL
jgi:hypothetical protein